MCGILTPLFGEKISEMAVGRGRAGDLYAALKEAQQKSMEQAK